MMVSRIRCLWLSTCLVIFLLATNVRADSPGDVSYWLSHASTESSALTDPAEKAAVLTAIAQRWIAEGDLASAKTVADQALPEAQQIQDANIQFRALLNLVAPLDQSGDADGAQSALAGAQAASDALPAGQNKEAAAAQLAAARSLLGGFSAARRPIDELPDPASRSNAFCTLAEKFFQSGQVADAAQAVKAAIDSLPPNPDDSAALQPVIARTQADIGDVSGAAATAAKITDPLAQADAYGMLADAYTHAGQLDQARDAIARTAAAAAAVPDESKPPILLHVARARRALGDTGGAMQAADEAVDAAERLDPVDRAYALAAASREKSELNDKSNAAILADEAATAAQSITDPTDQSDAMMAVAAAQGRAGEGSVAMQTVGSAEAIAKNIPPEKAHPQGDPSPNSYMDVVLGMAAVADYPDAETLAVKIADPYLRHEAILRIASAEVDAAQYQGAEDTAQREGSVDVQASVCGMIAASLARTRNVNDASRWTELLQNNSDKIAARLAVASFLEEKPTTRP